MFVLHVVMFNCEVLVKYVSHHPAAFHTPPPTPGISKFQVSLVKVEDQVPMALVDLPLKHI